MLGLLVACTVLAPLSASAQEYGATASVETEDTEAQATPAGRATTTVTRRQLEERLPRSAPDALRWEPGVSVQQTAHGQASPFVRAVTGQQVVLLFDGIRLNNGIYRQGPNQYFFTVDSLTLDHIDVVRGSGSTYFGSDAIGGAVLAYPREAPLGDGETGTAWHPRGSLRATTADGELGGRLELGARVTDDIAFLAGGGYRDVGQLESGGRVPHPRPLDPLMPYPLVPRFEPDGRTQRGTGFREATFDARLVARVRPTLRATAAVYGYRQFDAPRTDLCPPPGALDVECLTLEEQYRTLAYLALRGSAGRDLPEVEVTLSYQRHHERRSLDRPNIFTELVGRDDVDTLGLTLRAGGRGHRLGRNLRLYVRGGLDAYRDQVASEAWLIYSNVGLTRAQSRGQYMDGARYLSAAAWSELHASWRHRIHVRAGARATSIGARAAADPESDTAPISREWTAVVGRAGVDARVLEWLTLVANVDQAFRAPNLDDLTSRQQTGPGFQFENEALEPERAVTFEGGARLRLSDVLDAELWGFHTRIDGAIIRSFRSADECPAETPACPGSWSRFQLVNSGGTALIFGVESGATAYLPEGFTARATFAWSWGDAPNPKANDGVAGWTERVPLSRVPPMNGTAELRWRHLDTGIWTSAGFRWATVQDRLAPTDLNDARIPQGGTPAYAVLDLRAGWRFRGNLTAALVLENLLDTAYRVHGSSVNGAGRGLILSVSGGL